MLNTQTLSNASRSLFLEVQPMENVYQNQNLQRNVFKNTNPWTLSLTKLQFLTL